MSTGLREPAPEEPRWWVADVGASNARFAVVTRDGRLHAQRILSCDDYASLTDAAKAYLASLTLTEPPTRAAVALATPILGDEVALTNRPSWSFSISALQRCLELQRLVVINDFTALALSLPLLRDNETTLLSPPEAEVSAEPAAPIALLGPGTGLGVSGLVPDGSGGWLPLASEGGHRDLAAGSEREWRILGVLRREFGTVSAERVLSGPGLVRLYRAICDLDGTAPEAMRPVEVTLRSRLSEQAREAVEVFASLLGAVAGDLVLTLGARGGLFVGGGVLPHMGAAFRRDLFWTRYADKGRFRGYLESVPVRLVVHPTPALLGLAWSLCGKNP